LRGDCIGSSLGECRRWAWLRWRVWWGGRCVRWWKWTFRWWVICWRRRVCRYLSLWGSRSVVAQRGRNGKKRATTNVVAHFRDAPDGPPISWVPPSNTPSPIPLSSEKLPPTSLWKGERWLWLQLWPVLVSKPTSLTRGEGPLDGWFCVPKRVEAVRCEWWWWNERRQTDFKPLMSSSNSAPTSKDCGRYVCSVPR